MDGPFKVPDQAIVDAILDYTRKQYETCPVVQDADDPESLKLNQEDRLLRWFQDTRLIVDLVCQREGISGLNVLKMAVQAMEDEVIRQCGR